jgi:formylglycine-generating enzyme required for sulfatase activity
MVLAPAGQFLMGSDVQYPEERPAHQQPAGPFWIDQHPVTNAEFHRFATGTGWVTTAERTPDPADFPGADPADLVPGSLVFRPTPGPVPLSDWRRWWEWTPGADWRHPTGPSSDVAALERHPVVHVSYEDALAYAAWAGKQLPTEIEWEYAARAGRPATAYAWGEEFTRRGRQMANTWHGEFPWRRESRYERTSPVGSYPGNAWGLADMIGNVWEWTCSPWTPDHTALASAASAGPAQRPAAAGPGPDAGGCCGGTPAALLRAAGLEESLAEQDQRTIKGGSHLCAPSYCRRYRPPARQSHTVRSSASHLGFRCIIRQVISA